MPGTQSPAYISVRVPETGDWGGFCPDDAAGFTEKPYTEVLPDKEGEEISGKRRMILRAGRAAVLANSRPTPAGNLHPPPITLTITATIPPTIPAGNLHPPPITRNSTATTPPTTPPAPALIVEILLSSPAFSARHPSSARSRLSKSSPCASILCSILQIHFTSGSVS